MTPLLLTPGTIAKWIVGMPGPDIDGCLVIQCHDDGSHTIRSKTYGFGEWFDVKLKPRKHGGLYPSNPFVDEYPNALPSAEYLADLIAERDRLGLAPKEAE